MFKVLRVIAEFTERRNGDCMFEVGNSLDPLGRLPMFLRHIVVQRVARKMSKEEVRGALWSEVVSYFVE